MSKSHLRLNFSGERSACCARALLGMTADMFDAVLVLIPGIDFNDANQVLNVFTQLNNTSAGFSFSTIFALMSGNQTYQTVSVRQLDPFTV